MTPSNHSIKPWRGAKDSRPISTSPYSDNQGDPTKVSKEDIHGESDKGD